ncbi:MAG: primary-amine oxidase, partial [Acidimicrobiia bacterium]
MPATHPFDMLTGAEIERAVAIVRGTGRIPDGALFAHVVLHEPDKTELAQWKEGDPVDRQVRVQVVPGPDLHLIEIVVSVTRGEIVEWRTVEGMRSALLMTEAMNAIFTTKEHPDYIAALARRGITDLDAVQIDPWPAGAFGYDAEVGRRISRCISFLRHDATDNGYARPIEGIIVHFDLGRNEVVEVIDHGVVPLPPNRASYYAEDQPKLRSGLRPISITQPEGPSFTVDGNLVQWQCWRFRIAFDPYEGLVLHQVAYEDDGRLRPILHRASIDEMVVPYGDPGERQGWKNAFDAGEWGLGRMTQPLTLGCDCVGEIHYMDATLANEQGDPWVIERAICMHEEDYGILWKHVDLFGGRHEVRRSRRLVVSCVSTVGNYEYGFFWYFYLDGNIQL